MRNITKESVLAFNNSENFKKSNTEVKVLGSSVKLLLHGNRIAERIGGNLYISDGGYPLSLTTKERLNGLHGVRVHTSKGIHYLNGEVWDGSRTKIK